MKYAVVIERGPTSYGATVPDLPVIEEAIAGHIEQLKRQGKTVPAAQTHVTTVEIRP